MPFPALVLAGIIAVIAAAVYLGLTTGPSIWIILVGLPAKHRLDALERALEQVMPEVLRDLDRALAQSGLEATHGTLPPVLRRKRAHGDPRIIPKDPMAGERVAYGAYYQVNADVEPRSGPRSGPRPTDRRR